VEDVAVVVTDYTPLTDKMNLSVVMSTTTTLEGDAEYEVTVKPPAGQDNRFPGVMLTEDKASQFRRVRIDSELPHFFRIYCRFLQPVLTAE
jgi:hypothetical protein